MTLGSKGRKGAVSAIGAVSPPGGDISEPVSQATLRIVKVFWGLSAKLAYARHFPAIDWLQSYSLYIDRLSPWFDSNVAEDWSETVTRAMALLQEESELQEIVSLVGIDALSVQDRLKLETARSIREDYLHQNAFDAVDTYTSPSKQHELLKLLLEFYDRGRNALSAGAEFAEISALPVRERLGRYKYCTEKDHKQLARELSGELTAQLRKLTDGGEKDA